MPLASRDARQLASKAKLCIHCWTNNLSQRRDVPSWIRDPAEFAQRQGVLLGRDVRVALSRKSFATLTNAFS